MESKLKEYRARKRRQELVDNTKEKIQKAKEKLSDILIPNFFKMSKEKDEEEHLLIESEEEPEPTKPLLLEPIEDATSETSEVESLEEANTETWRQVVIKWSIYSFVWLVFYAIFLKLQFGAVFFAFSVLIGIYLNTRTRPRRKGEVSAYSVFNENCVSIDGTLKAEQFEREIRYGAGSVR